MIIKIKNALDNLLKSHWIILIVYILIFTIFHRWFLPGNFVNGDAWLILLDNVTSILYPYIWKGYHNLGTHYLETPFILINYLSGKISLLFQQNYNSSAVKILFFYVYLFFAPGGMYLLVYKLTKSKFASAISALIFTLNSSYAVTLAQGHLHLSVPPAFLPWIFWFLINYFDSKKRQLYLLGCTVFLVLSALYEVRFFYLFLLWIGIFVVFQLIQNKLLNWKKIVYLLLTVLSITIFANLFWILPSLLSATTLINNPILNRPSFGSQFMKLLYPMTNMNPYWSSLGIEIFTTQNIPWMYFGFLPLALLGFVTNKKTKYATVFFSFLCLGILITKQENPPFPFIYNLLFNYLPGFSLFRETSKIYHIISLSFAVLIGYYLSYLGSIKRNTMLLFTTLFLLFCVFYVAKPIVTGEAATMFTPVNTIDSDYQTLNNFLFKKNQEGYFRVFWLPTASSQGLISSTMPHFHLSNDNNLWQKMLIKNHFESITQPSDTVLFPEMNELLDKFSVRYVVIPKESTKMDKNFFYWFEDRNEFTKNVDMAEYLTKIDINAPGIDIYENYDYDPHFLLKNIDNSTILGDMPWVEVIESNPVRYTLKIHGLDIPVLLQFTEAYNDDWKIRLGKVNWLASLFQADYFLPNAFHIETDSNLNAFLINTSGDVSDSPIEVSLYYRPQSYFLLGIALGIVGLGLTIGLILYFAMKERKYEKK